MNLVIALSNFERTIAYPRNIPATLRFSHESIKYKIGNN